MTHDFENIRQRCLDAGDGCWVWGDALSNGTPAAYLGGRVVGVRRWIAAHQGKRVKGRLVMASCGDPLCVSPGHVVTMTHAEAAQQTMKRLGNYNADPVRRAKVSRKKREASPYSQELADRVREMAGEMPQREVARRLEVPQWWVNRVARGQAWAPLDSPFRALVGVVL